MFRRAILTSLVLLTAFAAVGAVAPARLQASPPGQPSDWQRFYYYPYVYYPRNFQTPHEYNSLYYRYPAERRIPVYNQNWHNFYPSHRPYHMGHHFILDVF